MDWAIVVEVKGNCGSLAAGGGIPTGWLHRRENAVGGETPRIIPRAKPPGPRRRSTSLPAE